MRNGLVVAAALTLGCTATFSPPIVPQHLGAAGSLQPNEGQVAAAVGFVPQPFGGTAQISIPVTEQLHLEAGGSFFVATFGIGWAGMRWTERPSRELRADVEWGYGLGRGGAAGCVALCPVASDDLRPLDRAAYGVYLGGGLAWWPVDEFALWVRLRENVSIARGAPLTSWSSLAVGVELRAGPVRIFAGFGGGGYVNELDSMFLLQGEGGLAIAFPVLGS